MLNSRLENLKKLLEKESVDATLVSSTVNIIYLTNFASFSDNEREAFLLILKNKQYIFTDARYAHAVREHVKNFELLEISAKSSFTDYLKEIAKNENLKTLGIENNNITVAEHKRLKGVFKKIKHFGLTALRLKKDKNEILNIRKACQLGDLAFEDILNKIKPGINERELAFELELFIRKKGAEISFPTIAAFEENAAVPHHHTGVRKLKNNELVLLDFGVKYENYCSDMTRTVFLGRADEEKKNAYEAVLNAQKQAAKVLSDELTKHKTASAAAVDMAARDYLTEKKYPSIPHSLGHGIGLEVHERPWLSTNSKDVLEKGMVFSIEPGIYLNNRFGIRIEDLYAIEDDKLIQLTNSSKKIIEL